MIVFFMFNKLFLFADNIIFRDYDESLLNYRLFFFFYSFYVLIVVVSNVFYVCVLCSIRDAVVCSWSFFMHNL